MIDSTIIRAHHHAVGAKEGLRNRVLAAQKFTTKIRLRTNAQGLRIWAEITGCEVSNYKDFSLVMGDPEAPPRVLIADKGYDADHVRDVVEQGGAVAVTPAPHVQNATTDRRAHLRQAQCIEIGERDGKPVKSAWVPYAQIAGGYKSHRPPTVGR